MAGLFSKKNKKEKEEKAAAAKAAAAAAAAANSNTNNLTSNASSASASAPANGGPNTSNASFTSSTSNLPTSKQGTGPPGAGQGQGQHPRDNSSANNSLTNSINNPMSSTAVSTTSASDYASQHQQQQQQLGTHGPSSKSSFDSDKTRMYQLQQYQQQQHQHHQQLSLNGPWTSSLVLSLNPFPRFSHTASYVHTGTDIYVFGGITKATTQKDMHVIDFPSLQCQVLQTIGADNPPPTAGHTAVTLGQYIMYFGGRDTKNKCSESLYVLHTVRKEWNRPVIHGLLPAPRHSHAACVIGTTMFIFGGQFNGYYLNDIASFDMKSLNTPSPKWSRLEPTSELPPARAGHCAAAYDGKVYIFGGADDNFFYNDIWCYDPQANNWEAVPAFGVLPTSRQGHACSVVEDTMYIYGGMNHEDQFLGDLSAFKFNDRRWLTFPDTPESPSPRTEHAMCAVGDKVYILGGQLELNAEDDAGAVYILDTTKIRYHEPSIATQRSNYDNDSTLQTEGGADDSNSSIRRHTPSPDSTRQHPLSDANYDPRKAFQQQLHGGSLDHIVGASSNSHSHRFSDDTNIGAHLQPRLSLDGTDGSPSRRRPLGKPTHYTIHEVEPRATQSVDETRRPSLLDSNDYYEQSRGQRPQQFTNGVSFSAGQQQQHESNRRRSLDSRNRGSHNQTSAHQPRASLDQSRSVGNAATVQQQLQQQHHYDLSDSQYYNNKEAELKDLRQREQWLLAEVAVSRKKMGERPMSLTVALKEDMGAFNMDRDSDKYKIMQALLSVKAELERSKTSIVTQAQIASNKLREAERVRTAALQEAAYLKAKVSALQSGEASSLASTEVARAVDLEKRLTLALGQIEKLQTQTYQHDTILERERHAREVAVERERQTTTRAEEAELSHTRSLAELATLHERASKAEASLRECEAKNATNEAGLSSFQQQSTALFSQISALKTTVDHQKKSLEKAKLAYSVANDRAEHADRLWTQARQEIDTTQLESAGLRADLDRAQREAEHWKAKAQDTDLLWQKAKSENEAMRTLLEEDMNESTYTSGSNSRKHDSIMAITSASRVAELEHELGTLRHLLRESQAAAAQANKDLGDAMVRTSQLEQSSMVARAEAAKAQRQLTASEDKLSSLETQLARKDESLEEMAKEQENNEVQLGVLRGVMRENGLLADDIILDALSLGEDGKPVGATNLAGLKTKAQELEKRAQEAESQLEQLETLKKQHEDRIQQLEADYQTAVHYVQGSETMLQRIRDEAQAAKTERDATLAKFTELEIAHAQCSEIRNSAGEAAAASAAAAAASVQLEGEVSDLHRQLHEAVGRSMELEQKMEELSRTLQESEIASESTQSELKTLKSKHHEHKKQALTASQSYQAKLEQLEASIEEAQASLAETQHQLESNQYELEQAHELNKSTSKELEEALAALKAVSESAATQKDSDSAIALEAEQKRAATFAAHHEDLQLVIDNAQKTIQELQVRNQDLEQQLRASENKISILLDNFQGPESVRNSVASSGGGDDLIMRLLEANHQGLLAGRSSHLAPSSHGDRSSADSLANELELLRSNWAQTHLNGTAYKQGSLTPLVASTVAATNEKASEDVDYAATTPTAENSAHDVKEVSTSEVAGEVAAVEESGPPSSISSSATAIPSSPSSSSMSNMTSAQKLEEYERMIDDMTNTRRTLEE